MEWGQAATLMAWGQAATLMPWGQAATLMLLASAPSVHASHSVPGPVIENAFGQPTSLTDLPVDFGGCSYDTCTSPAERHGYSDCWAGSPRDGAAEDEFCRCRSGHPRVTGRTQEDASGRKFFEYACCDNEDPKGKGEECAKTDEEDDRSIAGLIIVLLFWGCIFWCCYLWCRSCQRRRRGQTAAAQHHQPHPMHGQTVHGQPVHGQAIVAGHVPQPAVQMAQPVMAQPVSATPMPMGMATPMGMPGSPPPVAMATAMPAAPPVAMATAMAVPVGAAAVPTGQPMAFARPMV